MYTSSILMLLANSSNRSHSTVVSAFVWNPNTWVSVAFNNQDITRVFSTNTNLGSSIKLSQIFWSAFPIGAYANIRKSPTSFFMLALTNRQTAIILALRSLWTIDPADLQTVTSFSLRRIPTPCLPQRLLTWFGSSPQLKMIQFSCSSVLIPVHQVSWKQTGNIFLLLIVVQSSWIFSPNFSPLVFCEITQTHFMFIDGLFAPLDIDGKPDSSRHSHNWSSICSSWSNVAEQTRFWQTSNQLDWITHPTSSVVSIL